MSEDLKALLKASADPTKGKRQPLGQRSTRVQPLQKKEFSDEDRSELIKSIRFKLLTRVKKTITGLELLIPESEHPTIDARLAICQPCKKLTLEGCSDCNTCSSRYNGTIKKIEEGTCSEFAASPETKFQSSQKAPEAQPQRKVNNMFVYYYEVTYSPADAPTQRKTLRLVSPGLRALIEKVEQMVPGATVIGAPTGQRVDGIADGIIPAEVEVAARPQPGPQPIIPGQPPAEPHAP